MLKVAVHGDHIVTFAVCKPSRERGGLTKVSSQPDNGNTRVDCGEISQSFVCKICAPIINEDKLVFAICLLHYGVQPSIQFGDVARLVVERNNNGNGWSCSKVRHGVAPFCRHRLERNHCTRTAGSPTRFQSTSE